MSAQPGVDPELTSSPSEQSALGAALDRMIQVRAPEPQGVGDEATILLDRLRESGLTVDTARALGIAWCQDTLVLPGGRAPRRSGLLFQRSDGSWLVQVTPATGEDRFACPRPRNVWTALPYVSPSAGRLHIFFDPVSAAKAWQDRMDGDVGWVRGPNGWRGGNRRVLPDLVSAAAGRDVVLHVDDIEDLETWRHANALHDAIASTAGSVVVHAYGSLVERPFARKPKSAAQRLNENWASKTANPAVKADVPDPVVVARTLHNPSHAVRDHLALADIAKALLTCFDGHVMRGPDGLWTWSGGVWRPPDNVIGQVIAALLGDSWSPDRERRIVEYLLRQPELVTINNHPELDGWQDTINFTDGLYHWPRGRRSDHDARVRSTWQLTVPYRPDADAAPRFVGFLSEVLPADMLEPDAHGVAPWQEDLGYLLLPGNPLHVAFLLRGDGRNGKGAYMAIVQRIAGRSSAVSLEDITSSDLARFRLQQLYGSPLNLCGEIDPKYMASSAAFKQLVAGDPTTAERKHRDAFTFQPWATMVFSANADFRAADNSVAWWDRWEVRSFPNYIPAESRDPNLAERIYQAEGPAIANLALAGLRNLMTRGRFPATGSSADAKNRFRSVSDHLVRFIEERLVFAENARVERSAVLESYRQYCADEHHRYPVGATALYARIRSEAAAATGLPIAPDKKVHGNYVLVNVELS